MKHLSSLSKIFMPFGNAGNIYLLGALGQGIGPLVLTPLLTRSLVPQSFGEITFVTASASILSILFSLGLAIVISRTYVLHEESRNSINYWFRNITFTYVLVSVLLISIERYSIYLNIFAISLAFACVQLSLPMARAQNKPTIFAIISIANTLLPTAFILINLKIKFFASNLLALQIGAIITSTFSYILVSQRHQINKTLKEYNFKSSLKSSITILPHLFAIIGIMNVDRLLFGLAQDKTYSGFLQIIMLVATAPILILGALNHAWLNQNLVQLKENPTLGFKHINLIIKRLLVLSFLISAAIYILLTPIVNLLNPNLTITQQIRETILLTLLSSGIYIIYIANTHILIWKNRFSYLAITTPLALLIQVIFIQLLIHDYGYLAAAIGFGSALTIQVIMLAWIRRKLNLREAIDSKIMIFTIAIYWTMTAFYLL
jgi:O-antigen/teichoic acid export membrane protein